MNDNIKIITGGAELLDNLKTLREGLLKHHAEISEHFASDFSFDKIDDTKVELEECDSRGDLRVDLAKDKKENRFVGYCIIKNNSNNLGEIFSIFIEEKYRGHRIEHFLMEKSLDWLNSRKVQNKTANVLAGNEKVISFYKEFGFYPRTTILKQKKKC